MAKEIKTVAKYTESHDRLTVSVKFKNGDKLRLNSSRYRDSMSVTPTEKLIPGASDKIFKHVNVFEPSDTQGSRMKRAASFFEQFDSINAAAAAL